MERRKFTTVLLGSAWLLHGNASRAQAAAYQVLTLAKAQLPASPLATCADLEKAMALFAAEAARAKAQADAVGLELSMRMGGKRKALQSAIADARKAQASASIDAGFAALNLGLAAVLAGLGCAFAGPYAMGLLAGASVLTGVGAFAVQAYFKVGGATPAFVAGFARDRTFLFAELAASEAATSAARLAKGVVQAAALFVGAYELRTAVGDEAKAADALKAALRGLEGVDAAIGEMGTDKKAWAALYARQMLGGSEALRAYVAATRSTDCRFVGATGPLLRKP